MSKIDSNFTPKTAVILVACDNPSDANQIKQTLNNEFDKVFISTNPNAQAHDFESHRPSVLVLAFNSLEKAERYYLGLYRLCPALQQMSHRTIILCNKDDVGKVYGLCKKNYFDDYVMYWPMTFDMTRLAMAVHHALRELAMSGESGPSKVKFASQARRLGEMEAIMAQSLTAGTQHIVLADRAMTQAEQEIGIALDGLLQRLTDGTLPEAVSSTNAQALHHEIARIKRDDVMQSLRTAAHATLPIKTWANDVRLAGAPVAAAAKALNAMAEQVQPTVLVVDDNEFQCKIVAQLLAGNNYQLRFATSGADALGLLRKYQPDLILMDVQMQDLNGIEATRRIKAVPRLADIPVIMMTGQSDRAVVAESLKAGAIGFVVKPLVRENLLLKMAQALQQVV
jgi:CheY-like chemotaxis protein